MFSGSSRTHSSVRNCLVAADVEPSAVTEDSATSAERVSDDILRLGCVVLWVVDGCPCLMQKLDDGRDDARRYGLPGDR